MTYAVFTPTHTSQANDFADQIEVALFVRKSTLKAFDADISNFNNRFLDKNTANDLLAFLFWKTMRLQKIAVVQFSKGLDTDKHLRSFGNAYIGCLVEKPKKARLIEMIEFLDRPDKFDAFEKRIVPNLGNLKSLTDDLHIDEATAMALDRIYAESRKPLVEWFAKQREILAKQQQSFSLIKRDF